MGVDESIGVTLIAIGAIIMAYSTSEALRLRGMAEASNSRTSLRLQVALMSFFTLGYVGAIALLSTGNARAVMSIMSGVFLGGALFVLVTVRLTRRIAADLLMKQRELGEVNHELEVRVADRTRTLSAAVEELEASHNALAAEMNRRLFMEAELRQAQKLESVGRLAAGVAHEINTPVQFVNDSVYFLKDATTDLIAVIHKLQNVRDQVILEGSASTAADSAMEASLSEAEMDLPYLMENMPKALQRSIEGLSRVATIVRSMGEFARHEQREMSRVDLNRAIESTLEVSRGEYKLVANVETHFAELPSVLCHPGDINQVVLNIVINAAHAIGDVVARTEDKGLITVRTAVEGPNVVIRITDTGGGIPETARASIFDPFFTTKEVGKGTGQGLAIARSVVVDKHKGELTFETEIGKGTTFSIRLPIDAPAAS